jgi:oligo-1,6-glucosidase
MQWDDTSHAGFTEGIPWLPVNPNYLTINAAVAVEDPESVFHHFRKLIELRHDHPVVVDGRFELLLPDHEQIWALSRTLDDQVLLMIANCSSQPTSVPADVVPDLSGATVLLATHGDSNSLELAPWESRIYLLG